MQVQRVARKLFIQGLLQREGMAVQGRQEGVKEVPESPGSNAAC